MYSRLFIAYVAGLTDILLPKNRPDILQLVDKSAGYFVAKNRPDILLPKNQPDTLQNCLYKNRLDNLLSKNRPEFWNLYKNRCDILLLKISSRF